MIDTIMFSQGKDGYCFGILVSLLYFDKLILIVLDTTANGSIEHLFCIFTTIKMRCHTTGVQLHYQPYPQQPLFGVWLWEGEFPTCQPLYDDIRAKNIISPHN